MRDDCPFVDEGFVEPGQCCLDKCSIDDVCDCYYRLTKKFIEFLRSFKDGIVK